MKSSGNENSDERAYLYSGKLISRLGFFLLRGVDETPFQKSPATNPKDGIKRFPFLDYVRNFRKIHAILGDAPGGGSNWNGYGG